MVLFQPHRFSRTRDLFDRFLISFNDADVLAVAPVYSAGEDALEGFSGEDLVKGIKEHGHHDVISLSDKSEAVSSLKSLLREGDLFLTLGAGDIYREGERLLAELRST